MLSKILSLTTGHRGIPDFIAGVIGISTAFWQKNMFLSIAVGTVLYMVLVQHVFH